MYCLKLVFVDDDPDDRELIRDCLIRKNIPDYEIFESGMGLFNFLNTLVEDNLPNTIILDLNMPQMNGYEVLQKLKKNDVLKKIPVFILSTSKHLVIEGDLIKAGAAGYYQKPNTVSELETIIVDLFQRAT